MHPSQFVSILGNNPEKDWPALTGRDDDIERRESINNGRVWFWNLSFLRKTATNKKQIIDWKEVSSEKSSDNAGSSSGSSGCRARHPQMEKIIEENIIKMKYGGK